MNDRELLELAATAAGIDTSKVGAISGLYLGVYGWWNPLTGDGDALRLAVKLTLELDVCRTGIAARTPNGIKVLVDEIEESDPYVATRRAIVKAAAEIGRKRND